jgi:DNA mismatch repair ATPase MutL
MKNDGTTITIRDLFSQLPVRFSEFKKTYKSQYQKCLNLLQQYAIVATACRVTVFNSQGENMPFSEVFRTSVRDKFTLSEAKLWMHSSFGPNISQVLGR